MNPLKPPRKRSVTGGETSGRIPRFCIRCNTWMVCNPPPAEEICDSCRIERWGENLTEWIVVTADDIFS